MLSVLWINREIYFRIKCVCVKKKKIILDWTLIYPETYKKYTMQQFHIKDQIVSMDWHRAMLVSTPAEPMTVDMLKSKQ